MQGRAALGCSSMPSLIDEVFVGAADSMRQQRAILYASGYNFRHSSRGMHRAKTNKHSIALSCCAESQPTSTRLIDVAWGFGYGASVQTWPRVRWDAQTLRRRMETMRKASHHRCESPASAKSGGCSVRLRTVARVGPPTQHDVSRPPRRAACKARAQTRAD